MRIIAGKGKGKKLMSPEDSRVRPTLDRIKENIYNIIGLDIRQAMVLDLFSGSGALGIEALSRGAKQCVFVDVDKKSIALTKKNLELSGLSSKGEVLHMDAIEAIRQLYQRGMKFDYALIDPPYGQGIVQKILQQLEKCNIMQEGGQLIVETEKGENLLEEINGWVRLREKNYSQTKISIYQRVGESYEQE